MITVCNETVLLSCVVHSAVMNDELNPAANMTLHARAERAALEMYLAATATTRARRMKLMDRAAAEVFKSAGTPPEVASFYAIAVTALVLERLHHAKKA